jgi:polyisoprenoid-binding protein YceI
VILAALAGVVAVANAGAAEYDVDPAHSFFAVITHKAGLAARLAHDHLVVAVSPEVRLEFDPERPEATRCTFVVAAERLEVDAPAARAAWKGRLQELGIQSGDLPVVPDSDRIKVRAAMLGASQLDIERFPEIRAELVRVEPRAASAGSGNPGESQGEAVVRATIHGRTVERHLQARWSGESGALVAEMFGEFHFSEFGIDPYSAMLGAVRNTDIFHLYVRIEAHEQPAIH